MDNKKLVPNISPPSGLILDYRIALGTLYNFLEKVKEGEPPRIIHMARNSLRYREIPTYGEYFKPDEYLSPVNSSNSDNVMRLDGIVSILNAKRLELSAGSHNLQEEYRVLSELAKKAEDILLNGHGPE